MKHINWLGFGFLIPALLVIGLFFIAPVIMTTIFSFTNMSTATGISGGEYLLMPDSLDELSREGVSKDTIRKLGNTGYHVTQSGLDALDRQFGSDIAREMAEKYTDKTFENRRAIDRVFKELDHRITSPRKRKDASELFKQSVLSQRFATRDQFVDALIATGISQADIPAVIKVAYTGWTWTTDNFKNLLTMPSSLQYVFNTVLFVALTMGLFNLGFGLFLAVSTFYMPEVVGTAFRTIWFLPRILPPVLYIIMWKWLTWDTGFISTLLSYFGVPQRNWMMHDATNAWISTILINGFVGASMGMIIFSSAIRAIPTSMLHASEVDGASRLQQIRYIILPQLRWPILFVTSYETLSLITSFEYILLATDGGPGSSTEVWALAAYHTALKTYSGNLQYGLGASYALILVLIGILASLAYMRLFNFKTMVSKPRIER